MSDRIAGIPRLYIWAVVLFVLGLVNLSDVAPVAIGGRPIGIFWPQAIAGVVLVGGGIYTLVRDDPDEFEVNPVVFWVMVLVAVVVLLGTVVGFGN